MPPLVSLTHLCGKRGDARQKLPGVSGCLFVVGLDLDMRRGAEYGRALPDLGELGKCEPAMGLPRRWVWSKRGVSPSRA
jgi:hypothetical protein